jgi:hypothetical protein
MPETAPGPRRRGYAIASLVLGILSIPTLGLLLVGAMLAVVLGVVGVVKASREPDEYGGRELAVGGIVLAAISVLIMPILIGIGAGIAVPFLPRMRVAGNEQRAIADVRHVMEAEERYRRVNGGYFGTLECLAEPDQCVPGFHGSSLVAGDALSPDAPRGYHHRFYAGPAVDVAPFAPATPSLRAYAYVAFPAQPGRTGFRSFCGDSTGRLCYVERIGDMVVRGGRCPIVCRAVN